MDRRNPRERGVRLGALLAVCALTPSPTWAAKKTGAGFFMLNRYAINTFSSRHACVSSVCSRDDVTRASIARDFAGYAPRVLLLKRASDSNNGESWAVPGGNYDPELDKSLYETALREAWEELGSVPTFTALLGSIGVDWGDNDENEYTFFLVETSANNGTWRVELNDEHTESAWVALKELNDKGRDLHPTLEKLASYSSMEVIAMRSYCM